MRNLAVWVVVALMVFTLFNVFQGPSSRASDREINFSQFTAEVDTGSIADVTIEGDAISGHYTDGSSFTTRSVAEISSYSPVTTPFGYYGTSFDADRRSNGAFNFSMWGKEDAASNLKVMPHLIGLGSPEGEFSGFGHEGSGV